MKKIDVQIGATYLVKVTNHLVPVKLTREHPSGNGWEGVSAKTGKTIRIKSAQRLRQTVQPDDQITQAVDKAAGDKPVKNAKPSSTSATKTVRTKRTGPSLIQAAIQVLGQNKEPMTCTQMIESIMEQKLWSSTGKTPAQTLYSAILRDIQKKGDDARFTHVAKGQFQLNVNAAKQEA